MKEETKDDYIFFRIETSLKEEFTRINKNVVEGNSVKGNSAVLRELIIKYIEENKKD